MSYVLVSYVQSSTRTSWNAEETDAVARRHQQALQGAILGAFVLAVGVRTRSQLLDQRLRRRAQVKVARPVPLDAVADVFNGEACARELVGHHAVNGRRRLITGPQPSDKSFLLGR